MKSIRLTLCTVAGALLLAPAAPRAAEILIPMDETQTDHLKAYGVVYWALERQLPCEWLLNYRGGSFLLDHSDAVMTEAQIRGVRTERIDPSDTASISFHKEVQDKFWLIEACAAYVLCMLSKHFQ